MKAVKNFDQYIRMDLVTIIYLRFIVSLELHQAIVLIQFMKAKSGLCIQGLR